MDIPLIKRLEYSSKHTGIYEVKGSCGRLKLVSEDTIEEWLQDNSLGLVKWSISEQAYLIFDNNVMCVIRPSSFEIETGLSGPKDGKQYDYVRTVHVRISPSNAVLPRAVQKAFRERGLKEDASFL